MSDTVVNLGGPFNLFCERHLEPLRARWPYGYATLMMALFQHAVRDPEILRFCGYTGPGSEADTAKLFAAIAEFGPICCRLPEEEMQRWTELALADDLGPAIAELKALEQRPITEHDAA